VHHFGPNATPTVLAGALVTSHALPEGLRALPPMRHHHPPQLANRNPQLATATNTRNSTLGTLQPAPPACTTLDGNGLPPSSRAHSSPRTPLPEGLRALPPMRHHHLPNSQTETRKPKPDTRDPETRTRVACRGRRRRRPPACTTLDRTATIAALPGALVTSHALPEA